MKIVTRNDDPPHGDDKIEALFDDIYERFQRYITVITPDGEEQLATWIADTVQQAYLDGYAQGRTDEKKDGTD